MAKGTVKWFNSSKGFGFIAPEGGSQDVFVHASALERAGIHRLDDGHPEVFVTRGQGENLRTGQRAPFHFAFQEARKDDAIPHAQTPDLLIEHGLMAGVVPGKDDDNVGEAVAKAGHCLGKQLGSLNRMDATKAQHDPAATKLRKAVQEPAPRRP